MANLVLKGKNGRGGGGGGVYMLVTLVHCTSA